MNTLAAIIVLLFVLINPTKGFCESHSPLGNQSQSLTTDTKQLNTKLFKYFNYKELPIKAIKRLIDQGADVNASDSGGYTPLMFAAKLGEHETVQYLLKHGASPYKATSAGVTPITFLIWSYNKTSSDEKRLRLVKTLELFLRHGVDLNQDIHLSDTSNVSFLYYASGNLQTEEMLVKHGANPIGSSGISETENGRFCKNAYINDSSYQIANVNDGFDGAYHERCFHLYKLYKQTSR